MMTTMEENTSEGEFSGIDDHHGHHHRIGLFHQKSIHQLIVGSLVVPQKLMFGKSKVNSFPSRAAAMEKL